VIDKFIEVMDKLSNITTLKDEYKFHWIRAPYTVFMVTAFIYVYPKGEVVSFFEYMPSAYIFFLTIIGGMSLATRR
jgi:hypothetical protein